MSKQIRRRAQAGFTLIEVLVVLILVALLAAAVFPVVTQQLRDGDPVRVTRDLGAIKTGVESFNLNVRPAFPGDLEDLVHQVSTSDAQITTTSFGTGHINRWDGPYIDAALGVSSTAAGDAIATGYGAVIQNDLVCLGSDTTVVAGGSCASGNFVAAKITGLDTTQFNAVNRLVDGEIQTGADARVGGKLRCTQDGSECVPSYYLIAPFRSN